MKLRPKATYHLGTCLQCGAEGDVLTIPANPLDLSQCRGSPAFTEGEMVLPDRSAVR